MKAAVVPINQHKTRPVVDMVSRHCDIVPFGKDCDFFIQHTTIRPWGNGSDIFNLFANIIRTGKPILINEIPVIPGLKDKNEWKRLSWNSFLPNKGIFPYSDEDRWSELKKKYGLTVKDTHRPGDCVLFCAKTPFFVGMTNSLEEDILYQQKGDKYILEKCLEINLDYLKEIRAATDRKIIVRMKDASFDKRFLEELNKIDNVEISTNKNIKDDYKRTWCSITLSGTTCLETIFEGIPTITLRDGCISREVTSHDVNDIEKDIEYDLTKWLNKISYYQWNTTELQNGHAWKYLENVKPR